MSDLHLRAEQMQQAMKDMLDAAAPTFTTTSVSGTDLQNLYNALTAALPYWVILAADRSDQASQAGAQLWLAAMYVLGFNPVVTTNTRTYEIIDNGSLTSSATYSMTHAIWCPTPVWPVGDWEPPSTAKCPNCHNQATLEASS